MIAHLPEEYKYVRTKLYMNSNLDYAGYKKFIRNYWYAELGGNEMMENGTNRVSTGNTISRSSGISDTEKALNTNTGYSNTVYFK